MRSAARRDPVSRAVVSSSQSGRLEPSGEILQRDGGIQVDDGLGRGVEAAVERAEILAVILQAQGAGGDALQLGDGADDVEEVDLGGGERESLYPPRMLPAAGDEIGVGELLQDFGEVVGRDFGFMSASVVVGTSTSG